MCMNCVVESRRCVRKEGRKREKGVYIVNLVAGLISARGRVGFAWRLSTEFGGLGRIRRTWQNLAEVPDIAVETGGRMQGVMGVVP